MRGALRGCKVTLPAPTPNYSREDQAQTRRIIESAFVKCSGGGGGLPSRRRASLVVEALPDGEVLQTLIDLGAPGVLPVSITSDRAIRLRVYATAGAQTNDLLRDRDTDPSSGIGVLGEFVWFTGHKKTVSPSTAWFNDDDSVGTVFYLTIENLSGAAVDLELTFIYLPIEQ